MWEALVMSPFRALDVPGLQDVTYHSALIEDFNILNYGQPDEMPVGSPNGDTMDYITCTAETMAAIQEAAADEARGIDVIWAHPIEEQADE